MSKGCPTITPASPMRINLIKITRKKQKQFKKLSKICFRTSVNLNVVELRTSKAPSKKVKSHYLATNWLTDSSSYHLWTCKHKTAITKKLLWDSCWLYYVTESSPFAWRSQYKKSHGWKHYHKLGRVLGLNQSEQSFPVNWFLSVIPRLKPEIVFCDYRKETSRRFLRA